MKKNDKNSRNKLNVDDAAPKKKAAKIWWILLIVAIGCAIVGASYLCWNLYNQYTSGREYDNFKPTNPAASDTTQPPTQPPAGSIQGDTSDAALDNIPPATIIDANGNINFDELSKVNPDLYAWIVVPNTMIDYPVAQSSNGDNDYYLTHNMYGDYAFAGCIYTEQGNSKDFSDPNTVLYGHNMLNGSMFRQLHNFRDEQFFNENEYIYVYLKGHKLTYEIFSAYEYDSRNLLNSFNFFDKEVFKKYLDYAKNPTNAMMENTRNISVTENDKIITLSTCLGDFDTSRYLVQGVLVKNEPI